MPQGSYYHLGIEKQLKKIPEKIINEIDEIILDIGVDGLPLYKSSNQSLWPILAKFVNIENLKVILIGVYLGPKKPSNVDVYLHDFINEFRKLSEDGIFLYNKNVNVLIM